MFKRCPLEKRLLDDEEIRYCCKEVFLEENYVPLRPAFWVKCLIDYIWESGVGSHISMVLLFWFLDGSSGIGVSTGSWLLLLQSNNANEVCCLF